MASAAAGVTTPAALQPSDTFRVVGLPLWPSVGGNPNATVGSLTCEVSIAECYCCPKCHCKGAPACQPGGAWRLPVEVRLQGAGAVPLAMLRLSQLSA
jgi:hypothetical protein